MVRHITDFVIEQTASKPRAFLVVVEGDALAIFEASYEKYFGRRNIEKISIILKQVVGTHCVLSSEGQWISLALSKALYENYQNYKF